MKLKKKFGLSALALPLIFVLSACGASSNEFTVHDYNGATLESVKKQVEKASKEEGEVNAVDLSSRSRSLSNDKHWKVCSQAIAADTKVKLATTVEVGVAQVGEVCPQVSIEDAKTRAAQLKDFLSWAEDDGFTDEELDREIAAILKGSGSTSSSGVVTKDNPLGWTDEELSKAKEESEKQHFVVTDDIVGQVAVDFAVSLWDREEFEGGLGIVDKKTGESVGLKGGEKICDISLPVGTVLAFDEFFDFTIYVNC